MIYHIIYMQLSLPIKLPPIKLNQKIKFLKNKFWYKINAEQFLYLLLTNLFCFSPQQLVDCSVTSGNYGCGGGSLRNTLRYLEKVGGIMAYSDYPYIAKVEYVFKQKEDDILFHFLVIYYIPS